MPYADPDAKRAANRRWAMTRTRDQRRDEKRRQRAAWRAAGLNAHGQPIQDRAKQDRMRDHLGQCRHGCGCYDCLYGGEA